MKTITYDPSRQLRVNFDFNAMTSITTHEIPLFEKFLRKCETDGVVLLDWQSRYAEMILTNDATRQFMFGGLGSGRTFIAQLVERFCDELKAGL